MMMMMMMKKTRCAQLLPISIRNTAEIYSLGRSGVCNKQTHTHITHNITILFIALHTATENLIKKGNLYVCDTICGEADV